MRTSVFFSSYEKVFRRTHGVLTRLGLKICDADELSGNITAKSTFSLVEPEFTINMKVEEMEAGTTKVTIRGLQVKKHFFQRKLNPEQKETEILASISGSL